MTVKKITALLLSLVILMGLSVPALAATALPTGSPAVFGDYNGDGDIYADDARAALRASIGLEEKPLLGDMRLNRGDTDGNCEIDANDARQILRWSVGVDKSQKTYYFQLYTAMMNRVKSAYTKGINSEVASFSDSYNHRGYRFTYFNQSDDTMSMTNWQWYIALTGKWQDHNTELTVPYTTIKKQLEDELADSSEVTYSITRENSNITHGSAWNYPLFNSDGGTALTLSDVSSVSVAANSAVNPLSSAKLTNNVRYTVTDSTTGVTTSGTANNCYVLNGASYRLIYDFTRIKTAQNAMTGATKLTLKIADSTTFKTDGGKLPWNCSATRFLDLFDENFDPNTLGDSGTTDEGDIFSITSQLTDLSAKNMYAYIWYDPMTLEPIGINFKADMYIQMLVNVDIAGVLRRFNINSSQAQNHFYLFTGNPVLGGTYGASPSTASRISPKTLYPENAGVQILGDKT